MFKQSASKCRATSMSKCLASASVSKWCRGSSKRNVSKSKAILQAATAPQQLMLEAGFGRRGDHRGQETHGCAAKLRIYAKLKQHLHHTVPLKY